MGDGGGPERPADALDRGQTGDPPGGQGGSEHCDEGTHRSRCQERAEAGSECGVGGDQFEVQRCGGGDDGKENSPGRDAERNADRRAGDPQQQTLLQQLAPERRRAHPQGAQDAQLPGARFEDGGQAVEDDQQGRRHAGHRDRVEHELQRLHDAMQIGFALTGRIDLQAGGQYACDGGRDVVHPRRALHDDVDPVDEPGLEKGRLRGGQIHDDEIAAVCACDALRFEQPAHGEGALTGRREQVETIGAVQAIASGGCA